MFYTWVCVTEVFLLFRAENSPNCVSWDCGTNKKIKKIIQKSIPYSAEHCAIVFHSHSWPLNCFFRVTGRLHIWVKAGWAFMGSAPCLKGPEGVLEPFPTTRAIFLLLHVCLHRCSNQKPSASQPDFSTDWATAPPLWPPTSPKLEKVLVLQ